MPIQSSVKNEGSCVLRIVNLIEQIDIFPIFAEVMSVLAALRKYTYQKISLIYNS